VPGTVSSQVSGAPDTWTGTQRSASAAGREPAALALALLRAEYARLAAAARASVTAARAGAANPLVYVEAELARHGGLPPADATVLAVLADAAAGMMVATHASTAVICRRSA
jgi:hypothetical protein